ncbi:putative oxidoreductase GLYR1 homolog [Caerostris darwini]|uniref:Cytokine-like nuclear factor N-PAC n=1 Tax=Caerostris darwini TaxID=1538125 RepID=A0AAV4MLL8_9ARAC|nr:putative oxidoreductase GLYR1 homolog [Caerostris darwini]
MVSKKDFEVGDLVWAKMKSYPFWPAKIAKPPLDAKITTPKKSQHYVFFFGTANYAWISDTNILAHSETVLETYSKKKKSTAFLKAVDTIIEESSLVSKKTKMPVIEKESPSKSPESNSNAVKKVIKVQKPVKIAKIRPEGLKHRKKIAQKRHLSNDTPNRKSTRPNENSVDSEDYSELVSNTPPNLDYQRVAIIRPIEEPPPPPPTLPLPCAGITRRDYYELPAAPAFDLQKLNACLIDKKIKPTDKKIGFIGLGMMGQRIVKNFLITGHKVTIWNRTPDKSAPFEALGAEISKTPCDVVEKADITFCCVSGPDVSKALVFGNCGVLSGLEKCQSGVKGYVELTSIDPITSQEIAEAIIHKGARYLEAPLTGSRNMAEEGAILVLGAGDRELFDACQSCFLSISKHAYFIGCDIGNGAKMNLILSTLMGTTFAALAEAMALVERCNLSQHTFLDILNIGPMNCPFLSDKGQKIFKRDFTTSIPLKYQQKDLNLALRLGNQVEQPMVLAAAANELFKHAKLLRYSDHDVSAVYLGAKY